MLVRRMVVPSVLVAVLGAGGAPPGAADSAVPRPVPPSVEVSVTVPLDCAGQADAVTVTATLPRRVPASAAFPVTVSGSGVGGTLGLSLANATPGTFAVSASSQASTTQAVSTGHPGAQIELHVTGVVFDVPGGGPGRIPELTTIVCTPTGDTLVGSIRTVGSAAPRLTGSTLVDVGLVTRCTLLGVPFDTASVRIGFAVPTEVVSGETFSMPDLTFTAQAPGDSAPAIVATGATAAPGPFISPESTLTVTAAPGGHVRVDLLLLGVFGMFPVGCSPVGSGHLATIPVVAGPA